MFTSFNDNVQNWLVPDSRVRMKAMEASRVLTIGHRAANPHEDKRFVREWSNRNGNESYYNEWNSDEGVEIPA